MINRPTSPLSPGHATVTPPDMESGLTQVPVRALGRMHDRIAALEAETTRLRAALLECARMAEALKQDCGMDPESPQAIRNGKYMNISYVAREALSAAR